MKAQTKTGFQCPCCTKENPPLKWVVPTVGNPLERITVRALCVSCKQEAILHLSSFGTRFIGETLFDVYRILKVSCASRRQVFRRRSNGTSSSHPHGVRRGSFNDSGRVSELFSISTVG